MRREAFFDALHNRGDVDCSSCCRDSGNWIQPARQRILERDVGSRRGDDRQEQGPRQPEHQVNPHEQGTERHAEQCVARRMPPAGGVGQDPTSRGLIA